MRHTRQEVYKFKHPTREHQRIPLARRKKKNRGRSPGFLNRHETTLPGRYVVDLENGLATKQPLPSRFLRVTAQLGQDRIHATRLLRIVGDVIHP